MTSKCHVISQADETFKDFLKWFLKAFNSILSYFLVCSEPLPISHDGNYEHVEGSLYCIFQTKFLKKHTLHVMTILRLLTKFLEPSFSFQTP